MNLQVDLSQTAETMHMLKLSDPKPWGLGFRVKGLGFSFGFRVWGLGFWGLGFRVSKRPDPSTRNPPTKGFTIHSGPILEAAGALALNPKP